MKEFPVVPATILRAQNLAAEAMIDRILIAIEAYRGDASAFPMSLDLARLAGVLRIHFALGDRHLYPFMIASGQPQTIVIAERFQREVCHLGRRFDRFMHRWSSSGAIAIGFNQFRCDADVMLSALRDRLQRETRDLFPLADALTDRPSRRAA